MKKYVGQRYKVLIDDDYDLVKGEIVTLVVDDKDIHENTRLFYDTDNVNHEPEVEFLDDGELHGKVNKWFTDKNLEFAPIIGQLDKLQEEVNELNEAINDRDYIETIDAIGDIQVVLHGICLQLKQQYGVDVTPMSALDTAYEVIKDHTGSFNVETGMWEKDE